MDYVNTLVPAMTIGIDLGDKSSEVCFIDGDGQEREGRAVATTRDRFEAYFGKMPPARVVIECGTHSPWVSRLLTLLGHEVIVANPRAMPRKTRKFDKLDARNLARDGRVDPKKLYPIEHRGLEAQTDLAIVRSRAILVKSRTELINHVRGVVKSFGYRLASCSSPAFPKVAKPLLPKDLKDALLPVIGLIAETNKRIRRLNEKIKEMAEQYPETKVLRQVGGVGPLTSLAFVLLIEDHKRFQKSRDVGAYFGLVGKERSSGDSKPQLSITKAGDKMMRSLLTNAAHCILGPFGPDCDLRSFGQRISERGAKNAKKRAVSAVARKLAVLLHVLWKKQAIYDPLLNTRKRKGESSSGKKEGKMKTGHPVVSNC